MCQHSEHQSFPVVETGNDADYPVGSESSNMPVCAEISYIYIYFFFKDAFCILCCLFHFVIIFLYTITGQTMAVNSNACPCCFGITEAFVFPLTLFKTDLVYGLVLQFLRMHICMEYFRPVQCHINPRKQQQRDDYRMHALG